MSRDILALSIDERVEMHELEAYHIVPGSVWLIMATRFACRLEVQGEAREYRVDEEGYLRRSLGTQKLASEVGTFADFRAREAVAALRRGHTEEVEKKWQRGRRHTDGFITKLTKDQRSELFHLESHFVAPGMIWLETASRSTCRFYVAGERWEYATWNGAFRRIHFTASTRHLKLYPYTYLRAREVVLAVRQGHKEALERKAKERGLTPSKATLRKIQKLRQYEFKF